ncbi:unnamed protein product, partial [Amoebophrya sp. A25]
AASSPSNVNVVLPKNICISSSSTSKTKTNGAPQHLIQHHVQEDHNERHQLLQGGRRKATRLRQDALKSEFKMLLQLGYQTQLFESQNVIQVSKNKARAFFQTLKALGHP